VAAQYAAAPVAAPINYNFGFAPSAAAYSYAGLPYAGLPVIAAPAKAE